MLINLAYVLFSVSCENTWFDLPKRLEELSEAHPIDQFDQNCDIDAKISFSTM